jgi:hypothetical protein
MAVPVFDGHNDVLLTERSFAERSDEGHLDLERARAGAEHLPLVFDDLRALGWEEPELRLVAHANFLRVLAATLAP